MKRIKKTIIVKVEVFIPATKKLKIHSFSMNFTGEAVNTMFAYYTFNDLVNWILRKNKKG